MSGGMHLGVLKLVECPEVRIGVSWHALRCLGGMYWVSWSIQRYLEVNTGVSWCVLSCPEVSFGASEWFLGCPLVRLKCLGVSNVVLR